MILFIKIIIYVLFSFNTQVEFERENSVIVLQDDVVLVEEEKKDDKCGEYDVEDVKKNIRDYTIQVEDETALRIAFCESSYNPCAKNKNSSAGGLYQFLDGTWNNYCEGDKFNIIDNIRCFDKLYNKYPTWWECK